MLASSAIIDINNKYNEAIQCIQRGKTGCIIIGNMGKARLVYIVSQDSIELGVKNATGDISPLDGNAIELLKTGYMKRPKIVNMVDIANNLNTHSKLKNEH